MADDKFANLTTAVAFGFGIAAKLDETKIFRRECHDGSDITAVAGMFDLSSTAVAGTP